MRKLVWQGKIRGEYIPWVVEFEFLSRPFFLFFFPFRGGVLKLTFPGAAAVAVNPFRNDISMN